MSNMISCAEQLCRIIAHSMYRQYAQKPVNRIIKYFLICIGVIVYMPNNSQADSQVSITTQVDSRDYMVDVSSAHGAPVPPVSTNMYAWHSSVTCMVAQSSIEAGVNWRCLGWTGAGSVPISGDSNTTGTIVLTNLVSSIVWNWQTSFTITNATAVQRQGSKFVDISYDIVSDITNGVEIALSVSSNGVPVSVGNLTGNIGTNTLPGLGKACVWDAGLNWNGNLANLVFSLRHIASTQFIASCTNSIDARDYLLTIISAYGSPVPPVGSHPNYCWRTTITASVSAVTGYTVTGWSGVGIAPASGSNINTGAIVLTNQYSYIYWNWTTNSYLVTFDAMGGSAALPASIFVLYNGSYGALPATLRDYHTFLGWWTAPAGGVHVTSNAMVDMASNHILFARWTLNTQTISGAISWGDEGAGQIRAVAMNSPDDNQMKSVASILYGAVATDGIFSILGVPVLSDYWIKAFVDIDNDGRWSPAEPIGSFAGNSIFLTNDFSGVEIRLEYRDWDEDGIRDDEEAFVLLSNPGDNRNPILVDDDGPNDPVPGDPETSDPAENGTLSHPFDAIQEAINVATNGAVIVVMDGTYSGIGNKDINPKGKAITVRSRYGYNSTTIDVASVHSGFVCSSNETVSTVIKGFTIHTWAAFFGRPGVLCNSASPTIEGCRIWDCGVAGIYCTNNANPMIRQTIVEGNQGGVVCYGSSPVLYSCLIQSNYSGRGAGVLMDSNSHPYLVNTLVVYNRSTNDGGGLYVGAGCNPTGINCTVAYNVASNRGSALTTAGTPLFKNVILWGNSDLANDPIDLQSAATFTYSCLQEFHPGTGNKTNAPLFVSELDYQLQSESPCIDAGTAVGVPTNDYEGLSRLVDGNGDGNAAVDMGAYEFQVSTSQLPASWLAQYGLPSGDYAEDMDDDGDGFSSWAEWRAGTNPRDYQSFFCFQQWITGSSQGLVIVWPSITGRTYALDRSTNLTLTPAFSNIASGLPGQLGYTAHTDTTATSRGPYIYRVKVE